jgi:hypothetical protein
MDLDQDDEDMVEAGKTFTIVQSKHPEDDYEPDVDVEMGVPEPNPAPNAANEPGPAMPSLVENADGFRHGDVRQITNKEYHANALHGVGANRQRIWKRADAAIPQQQSITDIETDCPDSKCATVEDFEQYIAYSTAHYERLTEYYGQRFNKLRFNQFRGRQRAIVEAASIFFNNSKKYGDPDNVTPRAKRNKNKRKRRFNPARPHNPALDGHVGYPRAARVDPPEGAHVVYPPGDEVQNPRDPDRWRRERRSTPNGVRTIIAFGDGTFNTNMPGHLPSSCKKILKQLRHIERRVGPEVLIICMIGERHTSSMCSSTHPHCRARFERPFHSDNSPKPVNFLHRVRICETCGTRWHRDVNSARLIRYLFTYMQAHGDERPAAF